MYAENHDVAVIRHKSKYDSKGKKAQTRPQGQDRHHQEYFWRSSPRSPLRSPSTTTESRRVWSLTIPVTKLFKTKNDNYAIVDKGDHEFTIAAAKKGKEGTATVKVEEVKLSKRLAKRYKHVQCLRQITPMLKRLCQRYKGTLAEVRKGYCRDPRDAKKLVAAGVKDVWIDRVVKADDNTFSYMPTVLNLETGKDEVDPDSNLYAKVSRIRQRKDGQTPSRDEKKYKKRKETQKRSVKLVWTKALDKKDKSIPPCCPPADSSKFWWKVSLV